MILEGRFMHLRLAFRRSLYFLYKPFFKYFGKRAMIYKPMMLIGSKYICIGNKSFIFKGARIEVFKTNDNNPSLDIGSGCSIEQNFHLICGEKVKIGNNCMITGNSMISDVDHGFVICDTPYNLQKLVTKPVSIGDNVFIGMGSFILPGTAIGNNVIIGANSVVKGTFEDNVMLAGSPAKVIKKYNFETKRWENV